MKKDEKVYVVGHKNPETTKMYLAIDLTALRKCALNVPEIDPDYYSRGYRGW